MRQCKCDSTIIFYFSKLSVLVELEIGESIFLVDRYFRKLFIKLIWLKCLLHDSELDELDETQTLPAFCWVK